MSSRLGRSSKTKLPLQTFTYYIPAPPHRKTGYREREFDKIMQGISQSGFEIVEFHTEAVGGNENGGVFIIVLLRPLNKKAALLDQGLDIQEKFKLSHAHSSPDIILDEDDE